MLRIDAPMTKPEGRQACRHISIIRINRISVAMKWFKCKLRSKSLVWVQDGLDATQQALEVSLDKSAAAHEDEDGHVAGLQLALMAHNMYFLLPNLSIIMLVE